MTEGSTNLAHTNFDQELEFYGCRWSSRSSELIADRNNLRVAASCRSLHSPS